MDINLDQLSSLSGWQRLAEIGVSFGTNLLAALAIFLIGKWIVTYLVILMKATLTRAKVDRTLVSFLGNVANVGLLILVIIAALGKLGIPTTSVTALIGGAGLAVALSLKDQLSNFAAGALIILFRPFKVGDFIKVNGFEGTVSEIKMVQTSLHTPDNEEVILPNSVVMSNSIVNRSSDPLCRAQVVVGVDYACDLKAAKAAVLKAATEHPLCVQTAGREAVAHVTNLGDSAIEITLWAWTNEANLGAFRFGLNEQVVENLRAAKINIPFPQRDVHIITPQGQYAVAGSLHPKPCETRIRSQPMFSQEETQSLLAEKGIGKTVLQRLQQMGLDDVAKLAAADVDDMLQQGAALTGSTCWKNSPQARAAMQAAVDWAKRRQAA